MDSYRIRAAAVGLGIRPRRFKVPALPAAEGDSPGPLDGSPVQSHENSGNVTNYSFTDVRFLQLRHAHGVQGVLQVHQAPPAQLKSMFMKHLRHAGGSRLSHRGLSAFVACRRNLENDASPATIFKLVHEAELGLQ